MPILKKIPAALIVAALMGCQRASPEYEHLRKLPQDQWATYASKLPARQRLDLQLEISRRFEHPTNMSAISAFRKDPANVYAEIVRRLRRRDLNRHYVEVLYEIDGVKNFHICDERDRKIVQQFLQQQATAAVKKQDRPNFYTC